MANFLYLIQCNEYTKIGISENVSRRLADLRTHNPYDLKVLASFEFPSAIVAEAAIHAQYEPFRVRNEWFRLDENQIQEICRLCAEWQKTRVPLVAKKRTAVHLPKARNVPSNPNTTSVLDTLLNNRNARKVAAFLREKGYGRATIADCLYVSPVDVVKKFCGELDYALLRQVTRVAGLQP